MSPNLSIPCALTLLALPATAFSRQETTTDLLAPVRVQDEAEVDQRPKMDLTVEEALQLALGNNLDLRISETETEISRYDFVGSWGAFEWVFDGALTVNDGEFETGPDPQNPDLPAGLLIESESQNLNLNLNRPLQTGGSFNVTFNHNEGDSTTSAIGAVVPGLPFSQELLPTDLVALSYVQPLRRGAWSRYATSMQREAEVLWRRQIETQRGARQDLFARVHDAYWSLVAVIEQREVASSSLDLGLEQLDQNQRRLEAGVGTEVDVLQARAEVASRIEALLQAETNVDQAMDDLKLLLFSGKDGAPWDTVLQPTTPYPEVSTDGLPGWSDALLQALEYRSDLRQLRLDVETSRIRHSRTLSDRLAGVDLTVSVSSRNVDTERSSAAGDALSFEFPAYSATLNYNMPIGNKSADYAERSARARVRQSLLQYDRTETTVVSEVRQAVRSVRYQAEAVRAAEQSLELARRQLEAEEARYAQDLSTTFQVLEFQQSLIVALSNERNARVEFAKALVRLESAQGHLGEEGHR